MGIFKSLRLIEQIGALGGLQIDSVLEEFGQRRVGSDKVASGAVARGVQDADETAGVADGLFVPNDGFVRATALVVWLAIIFTNAEGLVRVVDGEDHEESTCRAGHKGKQFGLVDAEDVVKGEL